MSNIVKIVTRHSPNRSSRSVIPTINPMTQPDRDNASMVWFGGPNGGDRKICLSTRYEWHLCPNDDGDFITLKAYLREE